jgi:hypothetical protein
MKAINQLYPSFASQYPLVYTQLRCLKFVEIVRATSPHPSGDVEMIVDHSSMDVDLDHTPASILDAIKLSQEIKSSVVNGPKIIEDAVDVCILV